MKRYPWLDIYFKQLITTFQMGKGHHVSLIYSLPGMGDETLIYAVIRFLMCRYPKEYQYCGSCYSCQLVEARTHPDFYILESKTNKILFEVDCLIELNRKLHEYSCFGGAKIVWLQNITTLFTERAFSVLLHILENPPENTWFFLSCHEPKNLLNKLRGLCHFYHIKIPQESLALDWLEHKIKISQKKIITALRLCNGAPVAALELFESNMWFQRERFCDEIKLTIERHDWLSLLTTLNHDKAPEYLYWLISIFLDVLKIKQGITSINNIDNLTLVNILKHYFSCSVLQVILYDLCNCRKQLVTVLGINRELLLTNQLLLIESYL